MIDLHRDDLDRDDQYRDDQYRDVVTKQDLFGRQTITFDEANGTWEQFRV